MITPFDFSSPAGFITAARLRHVGDVARRLPADVVGLADRLRREFRRRGDHEHVGAGGLQRDDLRVDGRLGGLVGRLLDDHAGVVGAEPFLEADQVILAEAVVLIEHRDLGVGLGREDVLGEDARLDLVVRLPADRPREMLGIGELLAPVATNSCGTLLSLRYCRIASVGRGAERVEQEGDLLLLDQPANLFDGLRRAVAVVEADELDLAAVDPALSLIILK